MTLTLRRKCAFALAELIIFFTIISVMLALSAPLLTGKSNADPDKLMQLGDNNKIYTAMGNFQKLVVGHSGDNDKLLVNGTAKIKGDLRVGDSIISSKDGIFIGGKENPIFYVDSQGNSNLLMYPSSKITGKCTGVCTAPSHGYLFIENAIGNDFEISPSEAVTAGGYITTGLDKTTVTSENMNASATVQDNVAYISSYPRYVPISKNMKFKCPNGCYFTPLVTKSDSTNIHVPYGTRLEGIRAGSFKFGEAQAEGCTSEDEINYTCSGSTLSWRKVTIDATTVNNNYFCDWDSATRVCTPKKTSTTEGGDIYVSEELVKYNAKNLGNCAKSRDESFCKTEGDYWIQARITCKEQGAHLATAAELKALYKKKNILTGFLYYADEAYYNDPHSSLGLNNGTGAVYDIVINGFSNRSVCVRQ